MRHTSHDRKFILEAVFDELSRKAKAIRSFKSRKNRVRIGFELSDERRVIRRYQNGPDLLNFLAAIVLEYALETSAHFLSIRRVAGNCDHPLIAKLLGAIVGQWLRALRRGRGRTHAPRDGLPLRHVLGGSN